jgi:arylsulfatase A-like enzyme
MDENLMRPFFLYHASFSVHIPLEAPTDLVAKYKERATGDIDPTYCAMIESTDHSIGALLKTIDASPLAERTVVVFFSDNGGVHHHEVGGAPVTSNDPLRGGKATMYEGGTRVPLVVVWPGVVPPGTRSDQVVSSIDCYPTLLEMAGLRPPEGQRFDGLSIVPALRGGTLARDTLFCYFPHYTPATGNVPATWVRRGDWKLIRYFADRPDQTDRCELYHLGEDLGETNDRSAGEPDLVAELSREIDTFLHETGAPVPRPNPGYDPQAGPQVDPQAAR